MAGTSSGHRVPDRRQFLRGLAATGALAGAGSLLAACASSSSAPAAGATPASPRRGGAGT